MATRKTNISDSTEERSIDDVLADVEEHREDLEQLALREDRLGAAARCLLAGIAGDEFPPEDRWALGLDGDAGGEE